MKSIWMGAVFALAAVACTSSTGTDTGGAADSEMVVAPEIELSADARATASALVALAGKVAVAPSDPSAVAVAKLAQEALTDVVVVDLDGGSRKYFFSAIILEGGDIVTGSLHVVVTETPSGFEAGPSYAAAVTEEAAPATGRKLAGNDLRLTRALLGVTRSLSVDPTGASSKEFRKFVELDTGLTRATSEAIPGGGGFFKIEGVVLQGGDIAVGRARLVIEEKLVPGVFENDVSLYTARTILDIKP